MTNEQISQIETVVFTMADGAAVAFPVIAPFVAGIEAIVAAAEKHRITPHELTGEQVREIAAGMAAARASAVTSFKARR